jgi:hypothetical protein
MRFLNLPNFDRPDSDTIRKMGTVSILVGSQWWNKSMKAGKSTSSQNDGWRKIPISHMDGVKLRKAVGKESTLQNTAERKTFTAKTVV